MKSKVALILLAILTLQAIMPVTYVRATISVVSVVPSVSKIDDNTVGGVFSIMVTYSAPLDPSDDPTITLSPDLYTAGTLTYTDSTWSNGDTVYTANFSVADKDEIIPSVDATILGGTEAGIVPATPLGSYPAPNLFSVDTQTPVMPTPQSVVSVVPSATVINDSLAGKPFSIAVTFSGPMDTNTDPTVMFLPDLYTSGTLSFVDTSWSADALTYTINFTVNDLDEVYSSVDANIFGGVDTQVPSTPVPSYTAFSLFSIDTKSPTVTAANITTSGATGNGGVYKIGDTVKVSWDNTALGDNNTDVSGVTADFSQFGGSSSIAAAQVGNVWVASYTLPEGTLDNVSNLNPSITVTDAAGNATTMQDDANATVDNKINGYSVAINQAYINTANQAALAFTFANAEVGSTYDYDINGTITGTGTIATPSDMITGINVSSLADGTVTLSAHLTDAAGNVGNSVIALAKIKDTTPPTATTAASIPAIDLSSVGNQLDVTVKFSEPMNMASMPSVTFSPNIISSGTLTLTTMGWIDNKTYKVSYGTHTVPEAQPSVDITIAGGKDQHSNQMASALMAGVLSVDTMPVVPPTPPTPPSPTPTPTPPSPSPTPTPTPTPPSPSPTPTPTPPATHSSGGAGNILPPPTSPVVVPTTLATASPIILTSTPVAQKTDTFIPTRGSIGGNLVAAPIPTLALATPTIQKPVANILTNNQLAAAAGAGVDLFSGSKIYLWLLILIALIIFTRVTVAILKKEHR